MQATDVIHEEHSLIRCLLDCLSIVAVRAEESGQVDAGASELLDLFATFADGSHQAKEEEVLFPRLLQQASATETDRIQRLLADHGRDQHMMRSLQSSLLGARFGEPLSLRSFVQEARAYVTLHKRHMRKEHRTLMPLAARILTEADQARLLAAFEEPDCAGPLPKEELRERIEALCIRYGIPGPSAYASKEDRP